MSQLPASDLQTSRIGIDVGGTFTDAVIVSDDGTIRIAKVRSTPDQIDEGFMDGLVSLLQRARTPAGDIGYLAHGTTVATNAIVERRLACAALVTNAGFRDVLAIGTQMRTRVYDLWTPEAPPIVPRDLCFGVPGRIDAAGEEVEPLDESAVRAVAAELNARGVEAVAVMLLFSFLRPDHEQRIRAILAEECPGVPVSLSCEVVPEFREYVRASTTAVNAALLPLLGEYVAAVSEEVHRAGIRVPVHLMQSNGGVAPADRARQLPIGLAASGPAAGVIGGARLAKLVGEHKALTFDMGGTSTDIGLVIGGSPQLRFSGDAAGMPVNVPQIDVLCIGAGGGSIATVDAFGALRVGPASAGADPGPAAYGNGGRHATVTDAHVVLGNLSGDTKLAGRVALRRDEAVRAVTAAVGEPLGLEVEPAAAAILRIANANMANALRVMSIARGHDPRRFALVAIGGAGPMHACALAEELGIPRIVVPRYPGVAAALGLLSTDIRHDLRRSWLKPTAAITPAQLDAALEQLEREGEALLGAAPTADGEFQIAFELDMRYRGQAYNLTVAFAPRPVTEATIGRATAMFEEQHRRLYDYTPAVTETEIVTLRARALARIPDVHWTPTPSGPNGAELVDRRVWNGEWRPWRIVVRDALVEGSLIEPETIVEQEDTTVLVGVGWRGRVDAGGTLVLTREAG